MNNQEFVPDTFGCPSKNDLYSTVFNKPIIKHVPASSYTLQFAYIQNSLK